MNVEDFPSLSAAASGVSKPDYVPVTSVTISLEEELLHQYNDARRLLHDASYDSTIPLNQKAQIINSATSILASLTKIRTDLYTAERLMKIEQLLVDALKAYPDLQREFLDAYQSLLPED